MDNLPVFLEQIPQISLSYVLWQITHVHKATFVSCKPTHLYYAFDEIAIVLRTVLWTHKAMAKAVIEMGYGDGKTSHQAEVSVGDDGSEPLAGF